MIDLWGYDISRLVWFFAAGKSFFPGVGLLIISLIVPKPGKSSRNIFSNLLLFAGILLIILSATPLNFWFYLSWVAIVLCNVFFAIIKKPFIPRIKRIISTAAIGFCAVAILIEMPFHFQPKIAKGQIEHFYVIGDSISAGIGGKNEQTWPKILRDQYGTKVIDLSIAGATVTSAVKQAERVDQPDALVIIEIGGNDLFARTPCNLYEKSLSEILQKATDSGRRVIMLELPLRWYDIRYGLIQRRLARKFKVALIPKRFLAEIFETKGATVDLVHLSSEGHKLMAERVWNILIKPTSRQ